MLFSILQHQMANFPHITLLLSLIGDKEPAQVKLVV